MNRQKILNLLGLMMRAGKLATGEDILIKNIQEKKIKLLLVAEDCGVNTKKKLIDKAIYYGIDVKTALTTEEISNSIGKNNRVAVGLLDLGFKKRIIELFEERGYIDNGKN